MVQGAELLEPLRLLQRRRGQGGEAQQRLPAVDVEADVLAGQAARHRLRRRGAQRPPLSRTNGMGLREKYSASPRASVTTFTTAEESISSTSASGSDTVDIGSAGLRAQRAPPRRR